MTGHGLHHVGGYHFLEGRRLRGITLRAAGFVCRLHAWLGPTHVLGRIDALISPGDLLLAIQLLLLLLSSRCRGDALRVVQVGAEALLLAALMGVDTISRALHLGGLLVAILGVLRVSFGACTDFGNLLIRTRISID